MKIGFVLECNPAGPDHRVFQAFVRRLVEEEKLLGAVECVYVCQGNKRALIEAVGKTVDDLLKVDRCDHVFVIWDAKPTWPTMGAKVDCARETGIVTAALAAAKIPTGKTTLVCIKYELESWLIHDARAFGKLPHGKGATPDVKSGLREASPKDAASVMKAQIGLGAYLDYKDAHLLAEHVRFREMAKLPSFCVWFCALFALSPARAAAPFCRCDP